MKLKNGNKEFYANFKETLVKSQNGQEHIYLSLF